jgi:hypothetical protein
MSEYTPFKMKGSPFQRNFGIVSPAKDTKTDAKEDIQHKKDVKHDDKGEHPKGAMKKPSLSLKAMKDLGPKFGKAKHEVTHEKIAPKFKSPAKDRPHVPNGKTKSETDMLNAEHAKAEHPHKPPAPKFKSPAKDDPEATHPEHHEREKQDIIDIKKRIRQGDLKIGTKDVSGKKGKEAIRKELLSLKLARESDIKVKKSKQKLATYNPSFPQGEEGGVPFKSPAKQDEKWIKRADEKQARFREKIEKAEGEGKTKKVERLKSRKKKHFIRKSKRITKNE